eukprot:4859965-Pyramimonas_sp.AAC.1
MATWNCCSLWTTTNTIAGQSDLEKVLEETEAQVVMLQETRVRQAHKKAQPIKSTSYKTYYGYILLSLLRLVPAPGTCRHLLFTSPLLLPT